MTAYKEEATDEAEHSREEDRKQGICVDYSARTIEVIAVASGRAVLRFLRSFSGKQCRPPEPYRLPGDGAFAEWVKSHPMVLITGPSSPQRRLRVTAEYSRRQVLGAWRGDAFVYAHRGTADDLAGTIALSLHRDDGMTWPGMVSLSPRESGAGARRRCSGRPMAAGSLSG